MAREYGEGYLVLKDLEFGPFARRIDGKILHFFSFEKNGLRGVFYFSEARYFNGTSVKSFFLRNSTKDIFIYKYERKTKKVKLFLVFFYSGTHFLNSVK